MFVVAIGIVVAIGVVGKWFAMFGALGKDRIVCGLALLVYQTHTKTPSKTFGIIVTFVSSPRTTTNMGAVPRPDRH